MNNNVYFDNSSTTMPSPLVVDTVRYASLEKFANPSSKHGPGLSAAAALSEARQTVADRLHVLPDTIYFTAGGTISNNIAILGGAKSGVGSHAVTTKVEHESVLSCFDSLSKSGFDVTYVSPESCGAASLEKIKNALRENTSLISVMYVNNETGSIMPVDEIKAAAARICPRALIHTDAVQAFGKIDFYPSKLDVDLLSVSAHKVHGPKGIGVLYVKKGVSLNALIRGGGQEKSVHPGTENLPAIMGFAEACREIDFNGGAVSEINKYMRQELCGMDGVQINSSEDALPYILNVSFGKIPSEVMLNALSAAGISASAGSACNSSKSGESHVLKAMGKSPKSAVRFSFSRNSTADEAKYVVQVLKTLVPDLQKVVV